MTNKTIIIARNVIDGLLSSSRIDVRESEKLLDLCDEVDDLTFTIKKREVTIADLEKAIQYRDEEILRHESAVSG